MDGEQISFIIPILILIWFIFFWKSPEEKFKRKIKKCEFEKIPTK